MPALRPARQALVILSSPQARPTGRFDSLIQTTFFQDLRRFIQPQIIVYPDVSLIHVAVSLIHASIYDSLIVKHLVISSNHPPLKSQISDLRSKILHSVLTDELAPPQFITPLGMKNRGP